MNKLNNCDFIDGSDITNVVGSSTLNRKGRAKLSKKIIELRKQYYKDNFMLKN